METQDAPSEFIFKVLPWIEANRKRIVIVLGLAALAILVYSFLSYQRDQKEINAGQALTQAMMPSGGQPVDAALLKVAQQYPATVAGERAGVAAAAALFEENKFTDAQAQFQKYLEAHPEGQFAAQAALGVAASLDAQGKTDAAITAYQKVLSSGADASTVTAAKFALARLYEAQGKLAEAQKSYEDVARSSNPNSSLYSEAGLRAMELKSKLPAVKK